MRNRGSLALVAVLAAAALTLGLVAPAGAQPPQEPPGRANSVHCSDGQDMALQLSIQVNGETATGHYALPTGQPKGLVVFAHGYGHTSYSWIEHMKTAAREHDVIAVAMDYRGLTWLGDTDGDGLPNSRGWPARKGAEDLIAAAQLFQGLCPTIDKTALMGVSMGGNMSGLAAALAKDAKRSDGQPLFDYWINVEGVSNLIETYNEARLVGLSGNAFAKQAQADIEAETGGTFETRSSEYVARCVVCRIADIKASGVRGVIVIHGFDDGLVPYNQAREMVAALVGARIPTDMFSIARRSPQSERETTATGYVGNQVDKNYTSPLAGHASEKSTTHIVMVTAFERLWALMDGNQVPGPYREFLVDGHAGTFPKP